MRASPTRIGLAAVIAFAATSCKDNGSNGDRGVESQASGEARARKPFDLDGDGRLDPAEREARHAKLEEMALAEFDINRNGKLDPTEREAFSKKRAARLRDRVVERADKVLVEMDRDHDGRITLAEFESSSDHRPRLFDRADTNGDRVVERTELEAFIARAVERKRGAARRRPR